MAEGDSSGGIIVFALWYIAIAVGYAMDNFFKPKERYESETNTEVLSLDETPKNQDATRTPSFFTTVPPLFTPIKATESDTVNEPEQAQETSEPHSPKVMAVSEDSFVEASPTPIEEPEQITEIFAEYVAENNVEETIGNLESNQEFLHEEIPDAQTEEVTEQVFDIDD
ncbi:PREDICTED: uncharacterized protein LOC106124715 isoform X2 [Papilio xuthus]|nr:PREDICTED: uncharacterized protein LOC106124715 isoform X2 [Papilio xuthus]